MRYVRVFSIKGRKVYLRVLESLPKLIQRGKISERAKLFAKVYCNIMDSLKPIPPHALKSSAAAIDELERCNGTSIYQLKRSLGVREPLLTLTLSLMRSFGIIEILGIPQEYVLTPKTTYIVLTKLGEVFREQSRGLNSIERLLLSLAIGSVFKTKAKIIALSVLAGSRNLRELYNKLVARLLGTKSSKFKGIERLVFEILDEITLTYAGEISTYVSETQIAIGGLASLGLIKILTPKWEFEISTEKTQFLSPQLYLRLNYVLSNGDVMAFDEVSMYSVAPIEELKALWKKEWVKVIEKIQNAKGSINLQLERLHGIPYSF